MNGIIKFLSFKYGFDIHRMTFEDWEAIASHEGIKIKWLDLPEGEGKSSGLICWGHGNIRMSRPMIFLRKSRSNELKTPGARFTLMHEMGHYFLHPFTKYLDLKEDLETNPQLSELHGYTERDADLFAVMSFIPTKKLQEKYEDLVLRNLLKADNEKKLKKIVEDIYNHCIKLTKNLLGYDEDGKDLSSKAKRNLALRVQKFIDEIRNKAIIHFKSITFDVNFDELSEDEQIELLTQIKDVFLHYDEKI